MLSRPFLVLALAMFTATMGIGMVTPILPVYATSLGATGALVGLTFSSFAITQVLISPFSGRLADRYGRKFFLVLGLVAYVLSAGGWWLTESLAAAIAFRALSGVGSALIFALAHAYIGDLSPRGMEGRYMGTFGIFDFIGFGVGPVLAGAIRDRADIQTVFLSMALLFAASTIIVALLLPARVRRATAAPGEPDDAPVVLPPWRTIVGHRGVQALFAVRTAFACSMGASMSFIAIHLEQNLLVTATMVGVVLAGQQVTGGIAQPFVGAVADRLPRRTLVLVGALMAAAGYSTAAVSGSYAVILLGFIIGVGIGGALTNVAAQAVQVVLGRGLGMATVGSIQSMAFATGMLIGSLGGGAVAEVLGVPSVFAVGGGALVAGALLFALLTRGLVLEAAVPVGPLGAASAALDAADTAS